MDTQIISHCHHFNVFPIIFSKSFITTGKGFVYILLSIYHLELFKCTLIVDVFLIKASLGPGIAHISFHQRIDYYNVSSSKGFKTTDSRPLAKDSTEQMPTY